MRTNDPLKRFLSIRSNLTAEKNQLEARLREINEALGISDRDIPLPSSRAQSAPTGRRTMSAAAREKIAAAQRRRWAAQRGTSSAKDVAPRRRGERITLREAVTQLVSKEPLAKKDIAARIKSTGYKTTSKNVSNLLNQVLYGKNSAFKNVGGRFTTK